MSFPVYNFFRYKTLLNFCLIHLYTIIDYDKGFKEMLCTITYLHRTSSTSFSLDVQLENMILDFFCHLMNKMYLNVIKLIVKSISALRGPKLLILILKHLTGRSKYPVEVQFNQAVALGKSIGRLFKRSLTQKAIFESLNLQISS